MEIVLAVNIYAQMLTLHYVLYIIHIQTYSKIRNSSPVTSSLYSRIKEESVFYSFLSF